MTTAPSYVTMVCMMKIKPVYVTKYTSGLGKTRSASRNLFEKYEVGDIRKTDHGYTFIQIVGPRKTFSLISCAKPLTIIAPPEVEDGPAIKREVPLYFVSPMKGAKSIQGATYFAEINGELVPYRSTGGNCVAPL